MPQQTIDQTASGQIRVAVLIPCYNEASTIARVVKDFQAALGLAGIYVYDNNSTDNTADIARKAGAIVGKESHQGKGNVVRRMFADVEADVYVLVDGDGTYDAGAAPGMVDRLLSEGLDLVNAMRSDAASSAYRPGHRFGNKMISGMVRMVFGKSFSDVLSGYKVLSRRFVKSYPALASGFEVETEIAVHALELRMPFAEVETKYGDRPDGSHSKLNTIGDGLRILMTILKLTKQEKPLALFSACSAVLTAASLILAAPLFFTYAETGLVPRLPTAVLVTGMMVLAFLSMACGLILDTVTRGRQESKRMRYLSVPLAPAAKSRQAAASAEIHDLPHARR